MKDIFIDAINLSKNDQYELAEIYNNVKFPLPKTRYPYFQFIKL